MSKLAAKSKLTELIEDAAMALSILVLHEKRKGRKAVANRIINLIKQRREL